MIRTPYYDLAEMIINNDGRDEHGIRIFCCTDLPKINSLVFEDTYMAGALSSKIHKASELAWMSDINDSPKENWNHRAIALLLLHEMEVNP